MRPRSTDWCEVSIGYLSGAAAGPRWDGLWDGINVVRCRRGRCAEERGAEHGRRDGEESADEEGGVVAAVEGSESGVAGGQQAVGAGDGEAGEERETEGAAHHERGVDDSGGKAGFGRRDVTHGGKQHRIERD